MGLNRAYNNSCRLGTEILSSNWLSALQHFVMNKFLFLWQHLWKDMVTYRHFLFLILQNIEGCNFYLELNQIHHTILFTQQTCWWNHRYLLFKILKKQRQASLMDQCLGFTLITSGQTHTFLIYLTPLRFKNISHVGSHMLTWKWWVPGILGPIAFLSNTLLLILPFEK